MNRKQSKIIECIIYGVAVLAMIAIAVWQHVGGFGN